jgi:hypothetical protein
VVSVLGSLRNRATETSSALAAAAGFVAAQAAALVVIASALLVATATSSAHKLWIPLAEVALVLLVAFTLLACARALLARRAAARSPVVLAELLCLPVGYSLGPQAGLWLVAGPLLFSALAVLLLLAAPSSRAQLKRGI